MCPYCSENISEVSTLYLGNVPLTEDQIAQIRYEEREQCARILYTAMSEAGAIELSLDGIRRILNGQ
jgi:hypothetical protein